MTKTAKCRRCGRTLTDPKSIARGYGRTCARRVAEQFVIVAARYSTQQVDKAIELIGDGAIERISAVEFAAVSSDGTTVYVTTPAACSCKAGMFGRACYHRAAAELLAA